MLLGLSAKTYGIVLRQPSTATNYFNHKKSYFSQRSNLARKANAEVQEGDSGVILNEEYPSVRALPAADERYQGLNTVIVFGATGGVGRRTVEQLIDMKVPVKAFSRNGLKAASSLPKEGVDIVEGDVFSFENVAKAIQGCESVIICTGPTDRWDPLSPFKTDFQGNENIVAAAKQFGVKKIVLVSSIGADDPLFPLNLFGLVLIMKKFGELAVQRSGIDYTIIRPGGLTDTERDGPRMVVAGAPDTFGLPPRKSPGSIDRSKVAEACIASLVEPESSRKIIEIITEKGSINKSWKDIFAGIEI